MTRTFLILLVLLPLARIEAKEEALEKSPDGRFSVVVVSKNANNPDSGTLVFRAASSGKKIGSFFLGGFSLHVKLLWSPDGRFAAVQTHFTRHTMELHVFEVTKTGIKQVKLENYRQNIFGRLGLLHGGRGEVDKPLKWLSKDLLLIEAAGTFPLEYGDVGYCYEVELRMISDADDMVGWLEKIEKSPKTTDN